MAFAVLYLALHLAYGVSTLKGVTLILGFGALIEGVQFFLSYRQFSLLDVVADSVGVLIAVVLLQTFQLVSFVMKS